MKRIVCLLVCLLLIGIGCSGANLDYVKEHANEKWAKQGFEIVDYEGYQWGKFGLWGYGGAYVWYRLKKIPDNGITYSGCLQRWGDEVHVYGPKAIDAIRP
jgi:hypothetical protein